MNYQIEKLTSRQFEVLAANYAQNVAPHYNWILTKKTVDFNRDFEAVFNNNIKWGEAKHTQKCSSSISKNRWDPTLVSAVLKNNVDEIYFVTCGWIPLEYVVRAEHFKQNNIKKIFYINRYLLDIWLKDDSIIFKNFGEHDFDITQIMQSIKSSSTTITPMDTCIINIFCPIANMLEPIDAIEKMVIYEVNIAVFSVGTTDLVLQLPNDFIVTDTKVVSLSPDRSKFVCNSADPTSNVEQKNHYRMSSGYNQVLIYGFFNNDSKDKETICATFNQRTIKKTLLLSDPGELSKNKLSDLAAVESAFNTCMINDKNVIIKTEFLDKNDLVRNRGWEGIGEYNYFEFNGLVCNDAIIVCRIISKLILGIDYSLNDEITAEKTINSALNLCPFWISNIFAGTTNHIYALCALDNLVQNRNVLSSVSNKLKSSKGSIIFIDNYHKIADISRTVLSLIFDLFISANSSSIMVVNSPQIIGENNLASFNHRKENVNNSHNQEINSPKSQFEIQIINSLWNKKTISLNETNTLYELGHYYYEKTDFFKALFFYELIDRKNRNINDQIPLDCIFKYADCLNHCDSMVKSQRQFEKVIENGNIDNPDELKLVLEAKTEVFNLKFWRLEITHLVEDIDELLNQCYSQLYVQTGNKRDRYAFYNCLNRKMVTQYLIGDYECAEKTFRQYINCVDSNYINYLAFAYMDSARGLYVHDIFLAKERLETAMKILKELYKEGRECRRYFDCLVEMEYVEFIINFETRNVADISALELAVANVRNHGYKSMLIKCYLKLATCYLAQKNIDLATLYLSYVKANCDFEDDYRAAVLYNIIYSNLYSIKNMLEIQSNNIAYDFICERKISFNCTMNGEVLLETRIW